MHHTAGLDVRRRIGSRDTHRNANKLVYRVRKYYCESVHKLHRSRMRSTEGLAITHGFRWTSLEKLQPTRPMWTCGLYSRRQKVTEAIITLRHNSVYIELIRTLPQYQRLGYATALMKEIIANPPKRKRWIRLSIQPVGDENMSKEQLRLFYQKLGFRRRGKIRHTYQTWQLDTRK